MRITRRNNTLKQIRAQKAIEPAEPLILHYMNKQMHENMTLSPTIVPDKNTITNGQSGGDWRNETRGGDHLRQRRIGRCGNLCNPKQSHPLWLKDPDQSRVGKLRLRERNA